MGKDEMARLAESDERFRYFVIKQLLKFESRTSKLEVKSAVWGGLGCLVVLSIQYFKDKV